MHNETKLPNISNISKILKYLPYFKTENEFYKIDSGLYMDPYVYSDKINQFISDLYNENFMSPFDWIKWGGEARKYFENHDLIKTADICTIQKLLTTIVRSERFSCGVIASNIDNGTILCLLGRIKEIRDEIIDSVRGSLIGLAVCDALGVTLEFKSPGTFEPVKDLIGGGSFNLKPGE